MHAVIVGLYMICDIGDFISEIVFIVRTFGLKLTVEAQFTPDTFPIVDLPHTLLTRKRITELLM